MANLHGKVALITGGGRRIGACVARMLHGVGMTVAIHYRNSSDEAAALCAELVEQRAGSACLVRGDVSQVGRAQDVVAQCIAHLGRLDALINNASVFFPTPLDNANEAQWDGLMNTNLKAPFFISQAAAPHLKKTAGAIVNITDLYARHPLAEHAIYCASKAGLWSLTQSLAHELGPEIRVNAIAPGVILWPEKGGGATAGGGAHTSPAEKEAQRRLLERTPLKRAGEPDDIAKAVRFLLTEAGFITGQVLNIDGGRVVAG